MAIPQRSALSALVDVTGVIVHSPSALQARRMPAPHLDLACQRLAMNQHGVLSRTQALGLGMSPSAIHRRLKTGRWERIFPEVYRLAGSTSTWLQSLTAALLWAGDEGVAGAGSAAALWKLDGCSEGQIELFVPHWRAAPGSVIVHQTRLHPGEVTTRCGLRVTTAERTLLDLAARLPEAATEIALEDALRRRLTTIDRLDAHLGERWRCVPGARSLRSLVSGRKARTRATESRFETRLFALLRKSRLPLPQAQLEIRDGNRFIARVDFAYAEQRFIIEAHSFRWHSGRSSWERDVQRDKQLRRLGWKLLYVTYEDLVQRPEQIVADVRSGLSEARLFT